jgi:hypothetical protein
MSDIISLEEASQTCGLLNQLPRDQADQLLPQLKQEQPALFQYLGRVAQQQARESDGERIVDVAVVLWQIMKQGTGRLGRVTVKALDRAERILGAKVAHIAAIGEPGKRSATTELVLGHPQPYVLAWLYASMQADNPHGPPLEKETRFVALYHLQTMLDAMVASLAPLTDQATPGTG